MGLREELDKLFVDSPLTTTDQLCRVLRIDLEHDKNRSRAIRRRLARLKYELVLITDYTWAKP